MSNSHRGRPGAKQSEILKRKGASLYRENEVKTGCLPSGKTLPLAIRPVADGVNLVAWAKGNKDLVESLPLKHGGLSLRGFILRGVDEFEEPINALSGELMEYQDRATPRSHVIDSLPESERGA